MFLPRANKAKMHKNHNRMHGAAAAVCYRKVCNIEGKIL